MRASAIACLLVVVVNAGAVELTKTPTEYLLLKPKTPVVVDGKLAEWDMAHSPYVLSADSKDALVQVMADRTNPVRGDADYSARVCLAWDETYLYVAAQVTDDQLRGIKPGSAGNQGPAPWMCDSLMVRVASLRYPMKTNSPYSPVPFLGLRYAPGTANSRGALAATDAVLDARTLFWVLTEHSQSAVVETATGYDTEAAIPWKDLNYTPAAGETLHLAVLGADIDQGEPLTQIGWGWGADYKADPVFRLATRTDLLSSLTVSEDELTAGSPWSVRAELEARIGTAKLASLRVVGADGKVALTRPLPMTVAAGMTGTDLCDFAAGSLTKAGAYRVEAVLADGKVAAQAPLRVVAALTPEAAAAAVQGELRHMGPDRVAFNALRDLREGFYRHGFVKGKEDYVPFLRKQVEPRLKQDCAYDIRDKSIWGGGHALQCLAMYQATGDAEYAQLGRSILDYFLDVYPQGKSENAVLWTKLLYLNMYRYFTWLKDPNSPCAPPNAEKRYRAIMQHYAAQPPDDFFSENGTHNRVWQRYSIAKISRLVAEQDGTPIDPRVVDYSDYYDKTLGAWGDDDDASANYHWVFFDAAMAIYFFTGDWPAFLKNKGFTKTLSRYVEMVSPSGACVPFASGNGWPEIGMSMWGYELMSALTGDGRYRWTSHRIAEYYTNHLDDRFYQYHVSYNAVRMNFALAYLLADDKVVPKPAPAESRLTWRHPTVPTPPEKLKARPGTWIMEMDPDHWIPDKAVLSSGNDPSALWALVELLPVAGHGGEIPGSIHALMQHDAALLAGQGYFDNTADLQNLVEVEDLDGVAADPRPMTTEVPVFVEDPAFTFVRIKTTAYQHLPITYTRDILFYKNGFLVVKDRVRFDKTMKVRLGPCYNTRNLGPTNGPNWFNTYYDTLHYSSMGLGRETQTIRNPAWDLLIYFTPRENRKQTVLDRFAENAFRDSPTQLRQVWSGMARAGQEVTFTSVLLPHAPVADPGLLLVPPAGSLDQPRIEVARDDDGLTVLKVIGEMDPFRPSKRETWIMLNDTGQAAEAGPLASDGQVAVVGLDPQGALAIRSVIGGAQLSFRGQDQSGAARKLPAQPAVMPAYLTQ